MRAHRAQGQRAHGHLCSRLLEHAFCQILPVSLQAIKSLCSNAHESRIRDGLTHERSASAVQYGRVLTIAHLQALHSHLVKRRFRLVRVLVADGLDVALEEPLLDPHRVHAWTALVLHLRAQLVRGHVPRVPYLEIRRLEVALQSPIGDPGLRIGLAVVALSFGLSDAL